MNLNNIERNVWERIRNNLTLTDINLEKSDYIPLTIIFEYLKKFSVHRNIPGVPNIFKSNYNSYDNYNNLLGDLERGIYNQEYLKVDKLSFYNYSRKSLGDIIELSQRSYLTKFLQLRTDKIFIGGNYFLAKKEAENTYPIYSIVVLKQDVPSLIEALIAEREVSNDILKIWIDPDIYSRKAKLSYKLKVREIIDSLGLEIIKVDKFPWFYNIMIPKFNDMEEQRQWIRGLYKRISK